MRYLAIDPGTHCGWATWDGEHVESGVEDWTGPEDDDSYGSRFNRFFDWLCVDGPPHDLMPGATLVFEDQLGAGQRNMAARMLGVGYQAVIMMEAANMGWKLRTVAPSQLKKWATGNGRAGTDDMIEAAEEWCRRWEIGDTITDDNVADALLLLAFAREEVGDGS